MTPLDNACHIAFTAFLPGIAALAGKTHDALWEALAPHLPATVQRDVTPLVADNTLQNLIADAAQIAAGTAKTSANATKLRPLFAAIRLKDDQPAGNTSAHYPRAPLNPLSIFPDSDSADADLWQTFLDGLGDIPKSHHNNWPLWLDHFDTLWQSVAHAVPAAHSADVSLCDHSKTTAALATALWLRRDAGDDDKEILLIQGDFFGIQNVIFAAGSATNRRAAKILRGRSFHVSLFAEVAALKVLEACALPPTAQIQNAAGKFLILAPNTATIHDAIEQARQEMNQWLLEHCYGQVALGIATQEASCDDFSDQQRFRTLIDESFRVLERAKLQRFDLTGAAPAVLPAAYPAGTCPYDRHLPAGTSKRLPDLAALSADQIAIGKALTGKERLLILTPAAAVHDDGNTTTLELPIFGYHIAFTADEDISGKFGDIAQRGQLLRCWDYSLPRLMDDSIWHGYARRAINAYVPRFSENDDKEKYQPLPEEERNDRPTGQVKTFNHLACEERHPDENGHYCGKIALATLKGDVDNLGSIFQKGLEAPSLAKMAALSRQMNHFFSLWLPAYCAAHARNTYTVFAGGDDFFLIGPWLQIQQLAAAMREHFKKYVADNPQITFSAGIAISKPGLPVPKLSVFAEEALEHAKNYPPRKKDDEKSQQHKPSKNAICIYGETLSWDDWPKIDDAFTAIKKLHDSRQINISTGYLYDILQYCNLAQQEAAGNIAASIWRSQLYYRSRRFVRDKKLDEDAYNELLHVFCNTGIRALQSRFRIPLFNHLYQLRER